MLLCAVILLLLLAGSSVVARDQIGGWVLTRTALQAARGEVGYDRLIASLRRCGRRCPFDALIDAGGGFAALAERGNASRRADDLIQARAVLARALHVRPASGEGWAEAAFVESLSSPSPQTTLPSFVLSYRYASFSNTAGPWRAGWAAAHWAALGPDLKSKVLDEAAWLQTLPPERGGRGDGGLGEGAAAVALSLSTPRIAAP